MDATNPYVLRFGDALKRNPGNAAYLQKKADDANFWANIVTAIPAVLGGTMGGVGGLVLGSGAGPANVELGLKGAQLGSSIGGSLGGLAGNAIRGRGEAALDPLRERELRREALLQAIRGGR